MGRFTVNKKDTRPVCQLTGEDGNVFAIIGRVCRALKQVGQADRAREFSAAAFRCDSYGSVLVLCDEYIDVQ